MLIDFRRNSVSGCCPKFWRYLWQITRQNDWHTLATPATRHRATASLPIFSTSPISLTYFYKDPTLASFSSHRYTYDELTGAFPRRCDLIRVNRFAFWMRTNALVFALLTALGGMARESLHLFALGHVYACWTRTRDLSSHRKRHAPSCLVQHFCRSRDSESHTLPLALPPKRDRKESFSSNTLTPSRTIIIAHPTTDEPRNRAGRARHQGVFAMSIGHRGTMATVERDKHTSDRGRDQGKKLAVTQATSIGLTASICICASPNTPALPVPQQCSISLINNMLCKRPVHERLRIHFINPSPQTLEPIK